MIARMQSMLAAAGIRRTNRIGGQNRVLNYLSRRSLRQEWMQVDARNEKIIDIYINIFFHDSRTPISLSLSHIKYRKKQ